jgi:putative hydroxymethylpyrimidine transport system substrate-binding protein
MKRVAALLAAVLAIGLSACEGDGAEPGAPEGATLVLDFQPNAVHSGIYAAQANGFFEDEGIELTIREPAGSADSAKLLAAGRADFAVMDINDFGIARERGLDLIAIGAIVQRPLASVIARNPSEIRTPADLAGKTIGVTGVPSDDAVLDTILRAGGVKPSDVHRVTIGFNAVADLAAGKIDAATAFWNAEGVELKRLGVPIREFRVDEFGAPRYPELLIAMPRTALRTPGVPDPDQLAPLPTDQPACEFVRGLQRGYQDVIADDPDQALADLLEEVPGLDQADTEAQLETLISAEAFVSHSQFTIDFEFSIGTGPWVRWASERGLISDTRGLRQAFRLMEPCFPGRS